MKIEDLKVGMTIEDVSDLIRSDDRRITAIGEGRYLFINNTGEYIDTTDDLDHWQPKPEEPELFWLWRINEEKTGFTVDNDYMNEFGMDTEGNHLFRTWDSIPKFKILGTAITKDGQPYNPTVAAPTPTNGTNGVTLRGLKVKGGSK